MTDVPYCPQDAAGVGVLLEKLRASKGSVSRGTAKKGFSCKSTVYQVQDSDGVEVESWRFQDWDYKRPDLPTYARGLFTSTNASGQPEIASRGYDKFFNVGETNETQWQNIENNTIGPYELSLKENGCIIFISGLQNGSLLVCSKHSTGPRSDQEVSHAVAGEQWIDRQLKRLGRTRSDLAQELRRRNATAVAELCDDDFEEHILAYTGANAGLYLHGINLNTPDFATYSGAQVGNFAEEWGFRKVGYLVLTSISEARSFLQNVAETGSYNGRDVEGFVIRCKSRHVPSGKYQDWFFKYKFEEPYLMYRQWRECTKALIDGKPTRIGKHVNITEEYLMYARRIFAEDPQLQQQYLHNHGIIKLRDDFLKEKNLKGSDIIRMEYQQAGGAPDEVKKDVILVPIATIGCGKTTIALALQRLFNWGHVQNDNITGKNRPPRFTAKVLEEMASCGVVVADRNNAQRHERKQILDDVHKLHLTARLVALNFIHTRETIDRIRKVTQDRVFSRGDNHQTIQAASDGKKVKGIMEGFINRFEALNPNAAPDDGFDLVIDVNPIKDSRENLETIVASLHSEYPKLFSDMPSSEDLDDAISFALQEYKPDLRHDLSARAPRPPKNNNKGTRNGSTAEVAQAPTVKKEKPLEYFAVHLDRAQVVSVVDRAFANIDESFGAFWRTLKNTGRLQPEYHVTLMHRASKTSAPELWEKYLAHHVAAGGENYLGNCRIQLERVVWNEQLLLTIVVRILDEEWECSNPVPHITMGTKTTDIKPVQSNALLQKWLEAGCGEHTGIWEVPLADVVMYGGVAGVLSR